MGLGQMFKANRAYRAQKNGQNEEAMRLYEEVFKGGMADARYALAYGVLLIRDGQYQKARDFLVKHQKDPGMTPEQKVNLIVDYAACCFRLGDADKAIAKLEELHRKGPKSMIYQTLGYLYADKYDLEKKAAFIAEREAKAAEIHREAEEEGGAEGEAVPEKAEAQKFPEIRKEELSPEEEWKRGGEKALAFNKEAVEYDDEDPICLDNLAQVYYRVLGDREQAKPLFEKAHKLKEGQIDTLYFLSRYDLEAGNKAAAIEKLESAAEGRFSPLNYCSREGILAEIAELKGE